MISGRLGIWWTGLGRRERVSVWIAGGVLLAGVVYALGIEPAWKTRARLTKELPRLQAELVQLEALRAEAQRLSRNRAVDDSVEALRTAVEQSLLRAQIVADIRAEDTQTISVSASGVSAQAWFAWLESFARESRAAVKEASARRMGKGGRIDAFVSFGTSAPSP